jgi:hypothetical protein
MLVLRPSSFIRFIYSVLYVMVTHRIIEPTTEITSQIIDEWRYSICAFPLPPHLTPVGGSPFQTVSDDVLLKAPPHLISHIQRTASQGGLQVVSPRQTPFSHMMVRRSGTKRFLGDHDVGSIAEPNLEWPTLDDANMERLLPDDPLPKLKEFEVIRGKTKTDTLIKGDVELSDPVLTCLIKGRAVIDILRRPDVAGGPDAMAELLSTAWSVPVEAILELEAYSIGIEGSLQRHAMRSDAVYPVLYAPTQYRSVISVGVSDMDKEILPYNTAMDWRRARVFCESVFYNACTLEGLPIKEMAGTVRPGEPGSQANKPGTMTFAPAPGTAWTYDPSTFSIFPGMLEARGPIIEIPPEVRAALQRYVERVRPVSYLMAQGKAVDARQATAHDLPQLSGETLAHNYSKVVRTITTGPSRGKTAAATVRNAIYEALDSAPLATQLRLARYIEIAGEECKTHLSLEVVPDGVIDDLAARFVEIGGLIRHKIVAEAVRRGHTAEEWWSDILSQTPRRYMAYSEGTIGWAKVGMYLCFREPTDKWRKLRSATKWKALRSAQENAVGAVSLPPIKGSKERVLAAADATVKNMSTVFAGYYSGVSDVAHAVSKEAAARHRPRTADILLEGAYLWALRSRALRACNVHALAHEEATPSMNHFRIKTEPIDILVKPAPYRPYACWRKHMETSQLFPMSVKRHFKTCEGPVISEHFKTLGHTMIPIRDSKVTQYLVTPSKLGYDLERAWAMLVEDVRNSVNKFALEAEEVGKPKTTVKAQAVAGPSNIPIDMFTTPEPTGDGSDYYTVMALLGWDIAEGLEDMVDRLPEYVQEDITSRSYSTPDELVSLVMQAELEYKTSTRVSSDTVK